MKAKNFRKRRLEVEDDDPDNEKGLSLALEEVKFLQKQRGKKSGIPALPSPVPSAAAGGAGSTSNNGGLVQKVNEKNEGDGDDDLVLQDTFAQETAVMVEDPNMLRYVEQELAKKKGKNVDSESPVENEVKRAEDELYGIPEHLKVKRRNSEESSTQWTTGIAEIQLSIEYKLRNIEETEAAKKLLQEKRLAGGRGKPESSIPSSFSADFSQRGKDYAERLRKDNPTFKGKDTNENGTEPGRTEPVADAAVRRQAATDELMLERFRKRERQRAVRR